MMKNSICKPSLRYCCNIMQLIDSFPPSLLFYLSFPLSTLTHIPFLQEYHVSIECNKSTQQVDAETTHVISVLFFIKKILSSQVSILLQLKLSFDKFEIQQTINSLEKNKKNQLCFILNVAFGTAPFGFVYLGLSGTFQYLGQTHWELHDRGPKTERQWTFKCCSRQRLLSSIVVSNLLQVIPYNRLDGTFIIRTNDLELSVHFLLLLYRCSFPGKHKSPSKAQIIDTKHENCQVKKNRFDECNVSKTSETEKRKEL